MTDATDASAVPRLRIAVLNRVFSPAGGGAESYSIRLVEQLASTHEIHVFAQEVDHTCPGVTYHRISRPMKRPRWINQLWYAFTTWRATREGFDIVHSHENTWHGDVQTIHVKPVRVNLLTGRRGWSLAGAWLKIILSPRHIANLALEAARFRRRPGRQVVCTSVALEAQVTGAYPDAGSMISVITPGVALGDGELSREDARQQLGLPQSAIVLLFVANDYERKGLDALLAALARMSDRITLAVVGNASNIASYQGKARFLGVTGRVHFLGTMNDVGPAYRAADLLVHPTLDDTFAMVVLEAMAVGLPVVVSGPAFCGISSLLLDGRDAVLLDNPRDEVQLSAAISRVLTDEALSSMLSESGRRFASEHSWEEAARQYAQLYRRSLQERARRPA
jgi:glycosyltransferase involved in cell wall biosynthesis